MSPQDPIGIVINCGDVETIPDSLLTGAVVWGSCPCFGAITYPGGVLTRECNVPEQTLPCHVDFPMTSGTWRYAMPCSALADAGGKVEHGGNAWTLYRAATKTRIA